MASFFEKVLWTQCTGEMDVKCTKFINKEHLPGHKNRCECGSKAREVTAVDPIKAGIAALLGVALLGGGGWYVKSKVLGTAAGAVSGIVNGGGNSGNPGNPAADTSAVSWSVQTDRAGVKGQLSAAQDFQAGGNAFKYRDSLTRGDKMRIEVSYKTDRLYGFYRNGSEAMRLAADSGGRVTLPSDGQWFEMDDNAGTEEFILVAANGAVAELDEMTGKFDPVALDMRIRSLEASGKTPVVRIQIPHR